MTREAHTEPAFSIANLTEAEQRLLASVPDEEQRSVLYRELLSKNDIVPPIDLSVAENVLIHEHLRDTVFSRLRPLSEHYIHYFTPYGQPDLRRYMADRLGQAFGTSVNEQHVFGTAGVASALESIVLGLQQSRSDSDLLPVPVPTGSTVLLPAPFWQGFYWSFEQTAQLRCVPVHLTTNGEDNFQLTLEDLQRAYRETSPTPRLLVLTNPHNPLGVNYEKSLLESIYQWVLGETDMHIISDEMYCHSQLPNATPKFVSALTLGATHVAPDRVHVAWGFAKDFGLSGFRAGFVISKSDYVHAAMTGGDRQSSLAWFRPFDSLKHRYIEPIISDGGEIWLAAMNLYQSRLTESFAAVSRVLDDNDIPYVHPEGANSAQFFWLDLRTFLGPQSEEDLLNDILKQAGVKLLSGKSLTCNWPGYYRLCFTAFDEVIVVKAVEDMCRYLRSVKTM
jgi:aspartate/methionine/tyrosine aminotransferase